MQNVPGTLRDRTVAHMHYEILETLFREEKDTTPTAAVATVEPRHLDVALQINVLHDTFAWEECLVESDERRKTRLFDQSV